VHHARFAGADAVAASRAGSRWTIKVIRGEDEPYAMPAPVASPCVNVCHIEPGTGCCEGCLRTLDEIAGWISYSDEMKRAVWRRIAVRRDAAAERAAERER